MLKQANEKTPKSFKLQSEASDYNDSLSITISISIIRFFKKIVICMSINILETNFKYLLVGYFFFLNAVSYLMLLNVPCLFPVFCHT